MRQGRREKESGARGRVSRKRERSSSGGEGKRLTGGSGEERDMERKGGNRKEVRKEGRKDRGKGGKRK